MESEQQNSSFLGSGKDKKEKGWGESLKKFASRISGQMDGPQIVSPADLGITIQQNETLFGRLGVMNNLLAEMEDPNLTGLERIQKADKILKVCGVAWMRAGSGGVFSECLMHWESLKSTYRDIYTVIQEDILPTYEDPRKQRELVNQLNNLVERDFLPYAFTIINASFRKEDVSPAFVTA